ncbi:MAG: hypothetical protein A2Y78_06730 [Acidobacteria bacterium RBG_13_68_16]|nr:MAG: hypothetical protein A2Y78_06730 [Acidobacteria bacterium RBG_13_68_16]
MKREKTCYVAKLWRLDDQTEDGSPESELVGVKAFTREEAIAKVKALWPRSIVTFITDGLEATVVDVVDLAPEEAVLTWAVVQDIAERDEEKWMHQRKGVMAAAVYVPLAHVAADAGGIYDMYALTMGRAKGGQKALKVVNVVNFARRWLGHEPKRKWSKK